MRIFRQPVHCMYIPLRDVVGDIVDASFESLSAGETSSLRWLAQTSENNNYQ